jgi:hypothetical protein
MMVAVDVNGCEMKKNEMKGKGGAGSDVFMQLG